MSKYLKIIIFLFSPFFSYCQEKDSIIVNYELQEVILLGKDPISEKFSVEKLDKMDIYLNPASNADPLKAITILPSSSNTDETANPTLRGGSADRSRVYLNGSPITNPVRFGQENGLGNFSLFNTEMINKQYVYASNPPLTLGNSSAGLVEIETNDKLESNGLQFSLALSNLGAMWNKKLSKNSFFQLYGNYQFDSPFITLNKKSLKDLNSFSTLDIGANTHINITKNISYNSFNYYINEKYAANTYSLNFSSDATALKNRFFSVNNIDFLSHKNKIRFSSMFDYANTRFKFGNINSDVINYQYFNSIGVKTKLTKKISFQYGVESTIYSNQYKEIIPIYYYALTSNSPTTINNENVDFYYIEPYFYLNYEILKNLGISSAIRKNVLWDKGAKSFLSYQLSSHYEINNKNRIIISGGKYHSYTTPNYYIRKYTLLSSNQIALDYYFETNKINVSSAIYYKKDKGDFRLNDYEKYDQIETFGVELNVDFPLYKRFRLNLSNSYINQKQYIDNIHYNTSLNLKYFIKAQLTYNNPNLFNCSLLFTTRPGNNYTPVSSASFNTESNDYEPDYKTAFSSTFNDYKSLDFSINKLIPFKKFYIIAFASVNNLLNNENQSSVYYSKDYIDEYFNYFQKRIIYFGMQIRI